MSIEVEPGNSSAPAEPAVAKSQFKLALAWAIGASACFFGVYCSCNWIASLQAGVPRLYFRWELRFPLVPVMILPYLSEDVFFFFSPFVCRTRDELNRHGVRLVLTLLVAAVFFLLFPLHIGWPRDPVSGVNGSLFVLERTLDRPYNLVPSLHLGFLVLLWVVYSRRTRGALRLAVQVWFVLIGISTVLTQQHHLIDVVTGLMLGWLCMYLVPDRPDLHVPFVSSRRLGLIYAAGAAACLIGARFSRPLGLILIWPAISLAIVAAGYFALGPAITRKRDGHIPWRARLLLEPYLAGARLAAWLRHAAKPSQITPGVLLGGHLNPTQARAILKEGVTSVLDLTAELPEQPILLRETCYRGIPVLDLVPPTQAQLTEAVDFIEERVRHGNVYVHCALGYSRSVCVVAACLMRRGLAASPEEAISQIKAARPRAVARAGQIRALRAFEKNLGLAATRSGAFDDSEDRSAARRG